MARVATAVAARRDGPKGYRVGLSTGGRGRPMTKEELIAKMVSSAGITKVAAGSALDAFTGAVTASLRKGRSKGLRIRGCSWVGIKGSMVRRAAFFFDSPRYS